jgi:hypothetical protein
MEIDADREASEAVSEVAADHRWVKPEIVAFEPINAAEGLGFNPMDGFANLT